MFKPPSLWCFVTAAQAGSDKVKEDTPSMSEAGRQEKEEEEGKGKRLPDVPKRGATGMAEGRWHEARRGRFCSWKYSVNNQIPVTVSSGPTQNPGDTRMTRQSLSVQEAVGEGKMTRGGSPPRSSRQ